MAEVTDSILLSIKKLLGFDAEYTEFDTDIMMHINSVFSLMHQIGATPPEGFWIAGEEETWQNFLEGREHVAMVKSYMYFRVRLMFDPPTSSFALQSFKTQIDELEWRLNNLQLTFNPNAYEYLNRGGTTVGTTE